LIDLFEGEAAFLCEGGVEKDFPGLDNYSVGDAKHIYNSIFVKLVSWWGVCLMSRSRGKGLSEVLAICNRCGGSNGSSGPSDVSDDLRKGVWEYGNGVFGFVEISEGIKILIQV
jgi:hypothetical protein